MLSNHLLILCRYVNALQTLCVNPDPAKQRNNRQTIIKKLIYCVVFVVLSSCAGHQAKIAAWPDDLPPRDYFIDVYEQDSINKKIQNQSDYLTWVLRFYEGWEVNPRGWKEITKELLANINNPLLKAEVKTKMFRLGQLASGEWCKNNYTRTVNTKHIAIWGNALTQSIKRNETLTILNRITNDVEALISHRLSVDAITADRFYTADDMELW